MELYLDTADINKIEQLNDILTLSGVTTNPSILSKAGTTAEEIARQLNEILSPDQLLFIQAVSQSCEDIVEEARKIDALRPHEPGKPNTFVKIPVTHEGMKAIKRCKEEGIGVLATAIYSADQAFLAAMNGADYLAPYVNRMENYTDGIREVKELLQMLKESGLTAKVIAASFKNKQQVHTLITAGIQAVTIPPEVALTMLDHPGTGIAVQEFTENWKSAFHKEVLF